MRQALVLLIVVFVAVEAGETQPTAPTSTLSIQYSCSSKPFLSVSVYTEHHASFPDVEIRVVDPLGRSSGKGSKGKRIPKSHYGRVVEIPKHPKSSEAFAVEICEAIEGDYAVFVSGHDDNRYGFSVSANNGGRGNEAMATTFYSRGDRTCQYQFRLFMTERQVTLRWLTGNEHVQTADAVCESP